MTLVVCPFKSCVLSTLVLSCPNSNTQVWRVRREEGVWNHMSLFVLNTSLGRNKVTLCAKRVGKCQPCH